MHIRETLPLFGTDIGISPRGVCALTGECTVRADEYDLRDRVILIFGADGRVREAGLDLYANTDTVKGSPQLSFHIPRGGFALVFGHGDEAAMHSFRTVMEGAMLYNATMDVLYPLSARLCGSNALLEYDDAAGTAHGAEKWLFIGNSTTYFNGTPIKFKGLCRAAGREIDVRYCTFGSAYLREFADETHERGRFLREIISRERFSHAVIHDAGGASYDETKAALDIILPLLRPACGEISLYMRYPAAADAGKRIPEVERHIETYTRLARDFGLKSAPVAKAYLDCFESHPEICLYADDNSHHSAAGSYLIACVWLASICGIDPRGNGYTASLGSEDARTLQDIAAKYLPGT